MPITSRGTKNGISFHFANTYLFVLSAGNCIHIHILRTSTFKQTCTHVCSCSNLKFVLCQLSFTSLLEEWNRRGLTCYLVLDRLLESFLVTIEKRKYLSERYQAVYIQHAKMYIF